MQRIPFPTARTVILTAVLLGIAGWLGHGGAAARAEDFRIDNAVYAADKKAPTSESSTIFQGGAVYDCMKTPPETVVFDKAAGRFVLLNLKRKTRAELPVAQLNTFVEQLKATAEKSKDPLAKFLAGPKFEENADEETNEVTLTSPWLAYRVTLRRQPNRAIAEQYHEFSDAYARLNSLLQAGSRPPFGRLALNEAVAKRQAIAVRVFLTLYTGRGIERKQTTIHSEHKLVAPLDSADLERVKETQKFMEGFKLVTFENYIKAK